MPLLPNAPHAMISTISLEKAGSPGLCTYAPKAARGQVRGASVNTGLLIPARGYVELVSSRLGPDKADRIFRLHADKLDCVHQDPAYELPSLPFRWPDDGIQPVELSG